MFVVPGWLDFIELLANNNATCPNIRVQGLSGNDVRAFYFYTIRAVCPESGYFLPGIFACAGKSGSDEHFAFGHRNRGLWNPEYRSSNPIVLRSLRFIDLHKSQIKFYVELRKSGLQTFCNFSQLPLTNSLFTELFAYVFFMFCFSF